jgi:hypothetical protein
MTFSRVFCGSVLQLLEILPKLDLGFNILDMFLGPGPSKKTI